MDETKRSQIVSTIRSCGYTETSPRVLVTRHQFFDGNDDLGSLGCNLSEHPGLETFDSVFRSIEALPEVSGVFFPISELLDEEGMFPYTDTAIIVTSLSPRAFEQLLAPLQPDEIHSHSEKFANPPIIPPKHHLICAWWD